MGAGAPLADREGGSGPAQSQGCGVSSSRLSEERMVLSLEHRCVPEVSEKLFGITWRRILSRFRLVEF